MRLEQVKDMIRKTWRAGDDEIGGISAQFEVGLAQFMEQHPTAPAQFETFLRQQRTGWQNSPAYFRNKFLEHRNEQPERFAIFINLKQRIDCSIMFGEQLQTYW